MKRIISKSELFEAIRQPQAILFLHSPWSPASLDSQKAVSRFSKIIDWETPIYEVDIEQMNFLYDWVAGQEISDWEESGIMSRKTFSFQNRLHGTGELIWLKAGQIAGFEAFAAAYTVEKMLDRTAFLFWEYLTAKVA